MTTMPTTLTGPCLTLFLLENLATLDQFVDDLIEILSLAESDPASIQAAPVNTPVGRLDETKAARNLELTDS
jgi:glycine dehydrogenase subunit 2